MDEKSTNRSKAIALFKPDSDGHSRWVSVNEFKDAGLSWSNNGNLRRGKAFNLRDINWEVRRVAGGRSAVTHLKMCGWNKSDEFVQTINSSIKIAFESDRFCNLSLVPIPQEDREIDHRYGFKNHPDYVEMYSTSNQGVEGFQLLHRSLNLLKRQMCNRCVETGERPRHPNRGFAEGNEKLAARFPCSGCYLAEPEKFR
jgi:hypothetical protein